jgi:hypothetical protein
MLCTINNVSVLIMLEPFYMFADSEAVCAVEEGEEQPVG